MAKRTKRVAARKMKSRGGKARTKVLRKKAVKRAAPKKAKKAAKKTAKRPAPKARRGSVTMRQEGARKQKKSLQPAAGVVEGAIIDVIEERVPGVVSVTEFEAVSVAVPDSDDEDGD